MYEDALIRELNENDFDKMLEIFNYFALNSFAVYSDAPLQVIHLKKMAESIKTGYVIELNNKIIGFGYLSSFKPFPNFKNTGVLSYFILPEYTGKGLGTRLFNLLISSGKEKGIVNYLANISSKNEQSLNFHRKTGFNEAGCFKNIAFKFNEPFDMIWMQKIIE